LEKFLTVFLKARSAPSYLRLATGFSKIISTAKRINCRISGGSIFFEKTLLSEILFLGPGVNAYTSFQGEPQASLTFHVNSIKLHGDSKSGNDSNVSAFSNEVKSSAAGETTETADDLPF